MERKFKTIYVIISVVVVCAIAGIIIFLTSGEKYDKTIFMGNTTKITIDGQRITVSNDDEKIRKQKVKVFNNNKTIDGFVTSEEIGSSDIKNNIRIYSKDKKLLSGDPYTFAYTKGLNFTIIGFNTEQLDELSDMVKIFLQNNLDIRTVKPDYFVVNSYDIDDDGLIEHVYSMGLVHGENTYESIVTMEKDGNNYLIARETANYAPMYSYESFFGSAPFTDYIHALQLEHTGADLSFNAPLVFNTVINEGPIYMSDMFKLYRFENQIYVVRMTGREIRQHLELSYDQWVNTMLTPDDHIMLLDARMQGDQQRYGFKNLTFNFDSASGIDYEVDVTRPNGQKVRILQFSDGRPFSEDSVYRVAMNSYRGNGGGELLIRGAGIPKDSIPSRIEYMSERDQRYYLTEKIMREAQVTPKAHGNWRFVPEEWALPALERDRKLIFKK